LKRRLAAHAFDLAIDLSGDGASRPILLLAEARYRVGFGPHDFGWLATGFGALTRDPLNGHECAPHTTKLMGLIEWLGALARPHASVIRRKDLARESLVAFGIAANERYVVLHTGARLKFSRWPHYAELARLVLEGTDCKVVAMADDGEFRAALPPDLARNPRFQLIDQRLQFDQFDALLSFCAAFVGNDSGPKHLASLRGAPVVSIHCARNNWNEWGQENTGYIVSRRVPCAGCSVHFEPEDCGKDFACVVNVRTEEVFEALSRALDEGGKVG
jgi:ADP-heptose:LPS heptosyltransferase